MKSSIFGTYKNDTRAHGFHIHKTAPSMATTTMCTFKSDQHALPNLKFVLRCFPQYPSIIISYQESNKDKTKKIQQYIFMYTEKYHTVHYLDNVYTMEKQYYQCVPQV